MLRDGEAVSFGLWASHAAARVRAALEGLNPRGSEARVQVTLAAAMHRAGIVFEREVEIIPRGGRLHFDRIDFLVGDGPGLEVKIEGSRAEVLRQLDRYAESPRIAHLMLVTTRAQLHTMPKELREKPLEVLYLCPL